MDFRIFVIFSILLATVHGAQTDNKPSLSYRFDYDRVGHVMNMGSTKEVEVYLFIDSIKGLANDSVPFTVKFSAETLAPQFEILTVNASTSSHVLRANLSTKLSSMPFVQKVKLTANFIGHAILKPHIEDGRHLFGANKTEDNLHITVVQDEGVWGLVFKISVPLVIIISYINLGAQIDTENMKELLKKPGTLIVGFILTVIVMPGVSWAAGKLLLSDQLLYRIGSFVYACGPAASASTLWTIMLNADKELSVGLQVISTFSALFTMPMFLYFMDRTLQAEHRENNYSIQVPYVRLIQTLSVLMLALFVGWRFIGRHEKAQKLSQRIFRPLTFAVLIFIIIFSSILYWFIYKMFDWNITLVAVAITLSTYLISGTIGYLTNFNIDHAIAIAIGSAYKNEGIAFAVLFVAFGQPDLYIAYVPCLTQVVATSLFSYLAYCILTSVNYLRRRGQPDPIQATKGGDAEDQDDVTSDGVQEGDTSPQANPRKQSRSGSKSSSSKSGGDNDEFIAMNVTDIPAG